MCLINEAGSNAEVMENVQIWPVREESNESIQMQRSREGGICMSMHCSQVMYSEEYIQPSKLLPSRIVLTHSIAVH